MKLQQYLPLACLCLLCACEGYTVDTWKESNKEDAVRCDRSVRTAEGAEPSYDPCTRDRLMDSETQVDRFQRRDRAAPLD